MHFSIHAGALEIVEPLMTKCYDYCRSMLFDDILFKVQNSGVNTLYKEPDSIYPKDDPIRAFYENQMSFITHVDYDAKNIAKEFFEYFDFDSKNPEDANEDNIVCHCLIFMGYNYFLQREGHFDNSILISNLDLEYQNVLHNSIYPEILSLYKMILESKGYKSKGDKLTITYKQHKIDINSCAWFLDDMEKYFKDRFPDLTLEDINNLLPQPNKAGRKSKDPYLMIMIWGTYHLLKENHSYFKQEKTKISLEICQFIHKYLTLIGAEHDFIDTDIKENLKDMIKRGYTPKWNLPWRNMFSSIKEKEPESEEERIDQSLRRYNLSYFK